MNRILVVDDEEMLLLYLSKRLKKHNYDVVTCLSGEEALEKVKAFDFDVVILDVILPGIDGYEVCRRLKSDQKTSGIMALMLSVKKTVEERLKGYEVEADDYITKPYDLEELLAKIRILLRLKNALDERDRFINKLQKALSKVKTLSGLLPICSSCKKIRDDRGYWKQIEDYIREHSPANFSHSICPKCAKRLYPEFYKGNKF
jgi:DNA-binding response OmpR family regulator